MRFKSSTRLVLDTASENPRLTISKGALYSVKLKLEFWILNQLTIVASQRMRESQMAISGDEEGSSFLTATDQMIQSTEMTTKGIMHR